jgi:hypothetical protein
MTKVILSTSFAVAAIALAGFVSTPAQAATACEAAVQNVAWDYNGSAGWNMTNVKRLCGAQSNSSAPAKCFKRVMFGNVNWGGGTKWKWENAIDLCEGTPNADASVTCFKSQLKLGRKWSQAIRRCGV